ncbi:MAG: hypothetical protein HY917_03925 [Candidatus Diapherotrites archaeon]|nr:hypothetical protein [Candidatus Diapherotrites archaeon]
MIDANITRYGLVLVVGMIIGIFLALSVLDPFLNSGSRAQMDSLTARNALLDSQVRSLTQCMETYRVNPANCPG